MSRKKFSASKYWKDCVEHKVTVRKSMIKLGKIDFCHIFESVFSYHDSYQCNLDLILISKRTVAGNVPSNRRMKLPSRNLQSERRMDKFDFLTIAVFSATKMQFFCKTLAFSLQSRTVTVISLINYTCLFCITFSVLNILARSLDICFKRLQMSMRRRAKSG